MAKIAQTGVPVNEALDVLNKVHGIHNNELKTKQIENLASQVASPEDSLQLNKIRGAIQIPDSVGNGIPVIDPDSGKPYPKTDELINDYKTNLKEQKKMSDKCFNLARYSQSAPTKKKKTRGNPFRVLMGKIGKLLDHGLERREIVRYLMKEKIWNEETISKAIGIVKDYNKKKHHKQKKVEAQTLPNTAKEWPKLEVDYTKRSTAELIASILWLHSLATMNSSENSFGQEVADRSGVKNMIRKIKTVLLERGMSEKDLDLIMKKL
jgi:hypothetical protein